MVHVCLFGFMPFFFAREFASEYGGAFEALVNFVSYPTLNEHTYTLSLTFLMMMMKDEMR